MSVCVRARAHVCVFSCLPLRPSSLAYEVPSVSFAYLSDHVWHASFSIYASIFMHAHMPFNPSICPSSHTRIQAHLVGEFSPIKVPLGKAPRLGCIIGPRACAGMLCSAHRVVACMN